MSKLALLKQLCLLTGPSGNEDTVRAFILKEISPYCRAEVDALGNIIAFKKGKSPAAKKVMLDAHMDEVGIIITSVTEDGFLRFETVGGIEAASLLCKRVLIGDVVGVIGTKPIHLSSPEERKAPPTLSELYLDIGATDRADALTHLSPGDLGTFMPDFTELSDDFIRSKALDDRVGCATLIELLKQDAEYDFYATFTVGEELGLRGAKTAAFGVDPDYAVVLETTTAADLHQSSEENQVCALGEGVVISFMDRSTLYPRSLFELTLATAKEQGITHQIKRAVAGGNNAGAIHLNKSGVEVITLSVPCRYLHSSATVACIRDVDAQLSLAAAMVNRLASGGVAE